MRKLFLALMMIGAGCFAVASGSPASAMGAGGLATIGKTVQADTGVANAYYGDRPYWRHRHWRHRPYWRHRYYRPYRPYRRYYRPYKRCWWEYGYRVCRRYY